MLVPPRLMATAHMVPLPIAARVADLLLQQVLKIHPKLFDRLGDHDRTRFAFIPSDFSFAFSIRPAERTLRTFRNGSPIAADATITGPLVLMLALAEGRVDGDAVFFARRLLVSGDMEAVLALRNALDDNEIDLVKTAARFAGPMARSVTRAFEIIRTEALKRQGLSWN